MSGGNDFDPSREWLGVAAVDLADPFRALGISAADADEAAVTAAADRALARLAGIDPGPFRLAHQVLQRRIEACRSEAIDAITIRPQPSRHAAGEFVPPPPPPGRAAGSSFEIDIERPPVVAMAPAPWSDRTVGSLPAPADGRSPPEEFQLRRPIRRPRSTGVGASLFSLLALLVTGGLCYLFWPEDGPLARRASREVAIKRDPGGRRPAVIKDAPVPTSTPSTKQPRPRTRAVEEAADEQSPQPGRETPVTPAPQPPVPATPPAPPESQPEPPPVPVPRIGVTKGVEKALREALTALRQGAFDAADERVTLAAGMAEEDDSLSARVTAWRQLVVYARQLDGFRRQAMEVAVGDLDVGPDEKISVVESTPQVFKYKEGGVLHRIAPDAIPARIVHAIMNTWFENDERPGNHVFLGTHLLICDPPDLAGARGEWTIAAQGGADVSNVQPLLTDPIFRAAARQ